MSSGTVNLTRALPNLASNIAIEGPGADKFTVRRGSGGDYRIFTVACCSEVSISGVTITNGKSVDIIYHSDRGGGISNSGTLTVTDSTVSANTASYRGGGGIDSPSRLTITGSTISGNTSTGNSGGGGIWSNASQEYLATTIANSTISGNTSTGPGGGVYNYAGLTVIEFSTITKNTAPAGAGSGVHESVWYFGTRTEVLSTIISANTNTDVDSPGLTTNSFVSRGYNLIGDGNATGAFNQTGDQTAVSDPKLDPLGSYGGATRTHRLQSDSLAVDAGPPSTSCPPPSTDQRGVERPQDGDADSTPICDIGSFELKKPDTTAPTAKAPTHSFTTLGTSTVPVKLTWSATDNTGGSGIASYQLQQSVNGGAYTNITLPSTTASTISRSLAPGTNTYRFRVAAKDKAGNLSALASGPSFKVTAYQESNSAIVDTGSWTTSALSSAYGGSVQSASALGRNATFTVPAGTKNVEWVSYRGNRGKAQVWLDGVQQDANPSVTGIQPFDLYSSSAQVRKVVFSKAVSPTTSHKLEVRVLGQKNASSTSTRVDIDAFVTTS